MTAPTEAEIRQAIEAQWDGEFDPTGPDTPGGTLEDLVARIADPFVDSAARTLEAAGGSAWEPIKDGGLVGPEALWEDLRPSQAVALIGFVEAARIRAIARCRAAIAEELTAAGIAFAEAHPDAPRARKAVPA